MIRFLNFVKILKMKRKQIFQEVLLHVLENYLKGNAVFPDSVAKRVLAV